MTDYSCQPACVPCRKASTCEEIITHIGMFYPNREPDTLLKCGCTIPWPVIAVFGGHTHGHILCSVHGYQPELTKKQIETARKKRRKLQSGQTFDDIFCPF